MANVGFQVVEGLRPTTRRQAEAALRQAGQEGLKIVITDGLRSSKERRLISTRRKGLSRANRSQRRHQGVSGI